MSHVTIPMSSSAPVAGLSHDDRTKLLSPQLKCGSLKYADVSKVEVLDVNENFTETDNESNNTSKTVFQFSPDFKSIDHQAFTDWNNTESDADAELDTSQFTATTDHSSDLDNSSYCDTSDKSFSKTSPADDPSATVRRNNTNIPEYSLSPEKSSIFTIEELEEQESQPAVNDITSDWDVTNPHNTPNTTPVKPKYPGQTPGNHSEVHTPVNSTVGNTPAHTPPSGSKNKSFSELARVVSDAVRNILDSSSINNGEVSPQVEVVSSPVVTTAADTTVDSTTDTPTKPELDVTKAAVRQGTYELSELERAVEVDPTVEQDLIHSVINDEEAANNIICSAVIAESIVALSSISTTPTTPTPSIPSPTTNSGFIFSEGITEETSFELREERQAELDAETQEDQEADTSPDHPCQFRDSVIEIDDETKVTLSERKLHSEVFIYVSDSELEPRQNLQSEMDAASLPANEQTKAIKEPTELAGVNVKLIGHERRVSESGGPTENGHQEANGVGEQKNDVTETNATNQLGQEDFNRYETLHINGVPKNLPDGGAQENGQQDGKANGENKENNGSALNEGKEDTKQPAGIGETENHPSDLESTQDMTDVDEDLRMNEEKSRKQLVNNRKKSSVSRNDMSETSLEDLRLAVMSKEAVIALADRGMKQSPSNAVLKYQERKSKFDIRQDRQKVTSNGSLAAVIGPRPTYPTRQTRPLIGFKPGRAISIEGIVNKPAQSFSISLQTAEQPDAADVAMLISPSFNDRSILCNTYCHDTWGAPQIFDRKFPFTKGKKFEIKIATDTHCFKIFVNGHRLLDYDHRMPVEKVHFLRLEGDCVFNNVECPFVLDLPYVLDVDHGFRESSGVMLDAFIWPQANMFELNLLCGEKARQTHASFMMKVNFLEDDMVRVEMASFCNDRVGEHAMVEGDLSVQPGQDFKLRIIVLEKSFSIEVDGVELAEYDHHLPIDKLGHVLIDGDISLYAVKFMRPNRRVSSGLVLSTVYHDDRCCQCAIT